MNHFRGIRYVLLAIFAMLYGMAAYKFELPPFGVTKEAYEFGKNLAHHQTEDKPRIFLETPKEYLNTDVASLIAIRSRKDVMRLRHQLIAFLWGKPGLPSRLPELQTGYLEDLRYQDIAALERIDRLTVDMEYGLKSYVYHFIPHEPNGKVVLYNEGHDQDFFARKSQIAELLKAGYSVAAFAMPLTGLNNQPVVDIPNIGKLKLTTHEQLKFLTPAHGHPLKYFVEPEVVVLNYLKKYYQYSSISMIGFSGGGWVATIAAAVDDRIEKSFPVAGSYPIYLRSNSSRDWDDYEQTVPELYSRINYLELYVLGASGKHRKQLQILNQFDTCCFAGTKSETYKEIVRERVRSLGQGEYDLLLDASHEGHRISDAAMKRILEELAENR